MHIKYLRIAAMSLILLLSNLAWAEQNKGIKVIIEEPAIGESYSGIANLRGWAVAPAGMTQYYLGVYIDGEFAFNMPHGGARGDVGSAYPNYPSSDQSGFSMAFNYKNLTPGEHTIEVVGYDNNGDYNVASTTFNSERFSSEYINDASKVDLSTATDVSLLDRHTIAVTGATLENKKWDFTLKWDQASQSFNTVGILPSSGGSGGGTTPPMSDEVYACITSPDRNYSSTQEVVVMKNGLEINNYAGDYWSSSDEHVVFETASGKWYTIKNDEELVRLDVLAEPTSCFESGYGIVNEVNRNSSGQKVLILDGGEVTVASSCPVTVNAQLKAYGTTNIVYGDNLYIVDLLSGRSCKIADIREY